MNLRSVVAAGLTSTMLAVPVHAQAQEIPASRAPTLLRSYDDPDGLRGRVAPGTPDILGLDGSLALRTAYDMTRAPARLAMPNAAMTEVRLSHGAKVAIIVSAIVVGVLIIVGVIAIRPGHH